MAYDYRTGASHPAVILAPSTCCDGEIMDLPWSLDLYAAARGAAE